MLPTLGLIRAMVPTTCADDWPDRARVLAEAEGTDPLVRNVVLTAADTLAPDAARPV